MKILAANNKIRCVRCSCPPSSSPALGLCQQNHLVLTLVKEESRTSLKINTICNFQTMKGAVELNRLYVKKFLTNQCKVQFSRDKLGEEKVLKSAFPDFLRA